MMGMDDGKVCDHCGGAIPASMPACPVCEPYTVLASDPMMAAAPARSASGLARSVPVGAAAQVLAAVPALLVPPLVALGTVAAVGSYWLGRVDAWPFWIVEIFLMVLVAAATLAAMVFALAFARAITTAGVVNHFAGVDSPVATAVRQVLRRPVPVLSWTFMYGMMALTLALTQITFRDSLLQMSPGYAGVRNSQYVWQVMFGEDAGLARSMDRSAALVRARLVGSSRFSLVVTMSVGLTGLVWVTVLRAIGVGPGLGLPWLSSLTVICGGVAVWATLADIIDTAAWQLAYTGRVPAPFTRGQLGGDLDLPPADA